MRALLRKIVDGAELSPEEIRGGFEAIFEAETRDSEIAMFLTSLSTRGIDADVLTEAAKALRARMTPVNLTVEGAIDTCGTGGDRTGSFNFSTGAGLLAAACGVPVAKHGNRAITSKSGSADLLEALEIPIDLDAAQVAAAVDRQGFGFMMAPRFHPATARVQQIRKRLEVTTVFNFLGPLLNPAGVKRQVVGVFAPAMRPIMAEALRRLGAERAWVVSGDQGMDELSPSGLTYVTELGPEGLRENLVQPEDAGLRETDPKFLAGKDAAHNARLLRGIFDKTFFGPIRDGLVLNAGAALVVAGKAENLKEGVVMAKDAIESGAASEILERLKHQSAPS